jgi:hypothetical protein
MEASDMLDVIHFFFEEDIKASSKEEHDSVTAVRNTLYSTFYGVEYKYGGSSSNSTGRAYVSNSNYDFDDGLSEFSPAKAKKPYIPPTNVNPDSYLPFGDVLDAPLG